MDNVELNVNEKTPQSNELASELDPYSFDKERLAWGQFAEAESVEEFCRSWLAIQCRIIEGVAGGLILFGPPDSGPYKAVAVWPDVRKSMEHLASVAERALRERRGLLLKSNQVDQNDKTDKYHIAYPIEIAHKLHGVVVLDVLARPHAQLQAVLRQLHWGSAWLEVLISRQESGKSHQVQDNLAVVLDLMAVALEQESFYAAALTFTTELATVLACNRVAIGFLSKDNIVVEAVSHSAQFDKKSKIIKLIGNAMDEAVDQQSVIIYPEVDGTSSLQINQTHKELAEKSNSTSICTIPLYESGTIIGALTLEKGDDKYFDDETVKLCEAVAVMAGQILVDKRKNNEHLVKKIILSMHYQLEKLLGYGNVKFKLVSTFAACFVLFLIFANGDYRVSAKTVLEGEIQRVITSPFPSYVSQTNARAGDIVSKGQLIAVLEDKDLKLEKLKSTSRREQLSSQYREAMAAHERAKIRITMAQLKQINAQIDLQNYQLARTKIVAPFDGIIVSGDLNQSLGAPVDKGQVLFKIAPLDAYRVIIQVDERDISHIKIGQSGRLALSSLPSESFNFTVQSVTPVSVAEEGRNYFRVEAKLNENSKRLSPGMEGIGKIFIERRKIIWIWMHRLIDWFRLWLWSLLP